MPYRPPTYAARDTMDREPGPYSPGQGTTLPLPMPAGPGRAGASPMAGSPFMPYIPGGSAGDTEIGGQADMVQQLLESLNLGKPPQPPDVKIGFKILGSIGDAMSAAAAVRAGGTPPSVGQFTAGINKQRDDYRAAKEQYDRRIADAENMIRVGQFQREEEQKDALERIEAQNKGRLDVAEARINGKPYRPDAYYGEDDRPDSKTYGKRVRIVDFYDPMNPYTPAFKQYGSEAPFAPFVQPSIPGVSGPLVIPREVPPGASSASVGETPPAPPAVEEDFRKSQVFLDSLGPVKQAHARVHALAPTKTAFDKIFSAGKAAVGGSEYGGMFKATEPFAEYEATIRSALNTYIFRQTGLSFPEQAFKRYRSEFPQSWDSPELAEIKFANVARMAINDLDILKKQYPEVGGAGRNVTPKKDNTVGPRGTAEPPTDEEMDAAWGN